VGAFALGAGIPMLIIALTGRTLMKKLRFLSVHAEALRKAIGVVILLAVAYIASGGNAEALFASKQQATVTVATSALQDALPSPYPAPEFAGINAWLNSKPLTMSELKGKVVLIDFWTYSCINCVRTLPYITAWDKAYRDKGLVIVGVHAPEFEFEKNQANVEAAMKAHGIAYPVAMDNRLDTWTNFKNRYWPAHYLINKEGKVVYTHFGEGNYLETEHNIRTLLGVGDEVSAEATPEANVSSSNQTPETYLGAARAEHYSGSPALREGVVQDYDLPKFVPTDHFALSGEWKQGKESLTSMAAGASLRLNFTSGKVFLVLGTESGAPVRATLTLNGEKLNASNAGADVKSGVVVVGKHTLYELVNQHAVKNGLLEITTEGAGLQAYAFTFGL
jgi:thiol-disulfide isomerase/thioredoxin